MKDLDSSSKNTLESCIEHTKRAGVTTCSFYFINLMKNILQNHFTFWKEDSIMEL